jgi:hypothetical protein
MWVFKVLVFPKPMPQAETLFLIVGAASRKNASHGGKRAKISEDTAKAQQGGRTILRQRGGGYDER